MAHFSATQCTTKVRVFGQIFVPVKLRVPKSVPIRVGVLQPHPSRGIHFPDKLPTMTYIKHHHYIFPSFPSFRKSPPLLQKPMGLWA